MRSERDRSGDVRACNERPSVEWEHAVKSFTEDGYTVQIDRLPLARPRFSISIGVFRGGADRAGNFTSRIGARYNHVDGHVHFETLPTHGLIDRLISLAAEWIEAEVLANETRWQERQQRRQKYFSDEKDQNKTPHTRVERER